MPKAFRSISTTTTLTCCLRLACWFLAGAALAACGSYADPALRPVEPASMQATVEKLAKDLLVPGAVVIVKTPRGNFSTTYGVRTYRGSEPSARDLHVRIGSVTKSLVGAILQQVQEGRLALTDRVSKYRSDVPNGTNITIAQLLDMSSGLFNYTETLELNKTLDDQPQKAWTQQELLAIAFANKPYFEPGRGFHYSNTNTVLLGLIAEQIDGGKPLANVLHDRVFAPLGLKRTLLPAISASTLPSPNARGYMYGSNVLTMGSPPAVPPDMQAAARAGTLAPVDETDANPSWAWAAGAGISTPDEVVTLVRALVNGNLLGPELQAQRLASVKPLDPTNPGSAGYGLALAKFGNLYGHTGELPGYNTFAGHDPVRDVTVVVSTNLGPAADGRAPATTIAAALIGAIYAPTP